MQTQTISPSSLSAGSARPLKAVVLRGAGQRAADLTWSHSLRRLLRRVAGSVRWDTHVISLDPAREVSTENLLLAALDADYLVVDVRQSAGFPVRLRQWLADWAEQRQVVNALISTLDEERGPDTAMPIFVRPFLRQLAERHGLRFIEGDATEELPATPPPAWPGWAAEAPFPSVRSSQLHYA